MTSSGASSASVLPFTTNTTPSAPTPTDDPSQSFSDVLQQQSDGKSPAGQKASATPAAATTPATVTTSTGTPTSPQPVTRSMTIVAPATVTNARSPLRDTVSLTTTVLAAATAQATATTSPGTSTARSASSANFAPGSTKSTAKAPVTASVTPTSTAVAPASTSTPTPTPAPTVTSGSDMSTMMIQAMLHASQLQSSQHLPAVEAITSRPSSRATGTPTATTPTGAANLSATAIPSALATKAAATSAQSAATQVAAAATTTAQAVTAMAAAMSATGDSGSISRTGIPLSGSAATTTPGETKEKKSTAVTSEGSFLQASSAASTGSVDSSNLTITAVGAVDNSSGNQHVATQSSSTKNTASGLAISATPSVGTDRDEKRTTMNTDLNLPDMLAGASANTASSTSPEVNILLSSNTDFADALKQVIHIAQINDATGSTTEPTRVAIELQTPPGAIVNVYVSKQDDSTYRAQLSTSDPAALSWVQDKITSLRQDNDMGVQVKWLPAQIESASSLSATTPSGDGSNLNWNRDGQQQNNPAPDDQSQYQRQAQSLYEDDLTEADADTFASNFEAVGGAA